MEEVIFTPVYEEIEYLYHECSECGYTIDLKDGRLFRSDRYFGDTSDIRFCPKCGKAVIRFSEKGKYITPIDFSPLRRFKDLIEDAEKRCAYRYIQLSDYEQQQLKSIMKFAESDADKQIVKLIEDSKFYRRSHQSCRKLIREFSLETKEE